ncbi:MAG TPA: hypothetical protein VFA65_05570 [Bryobacteraceae bacterium]|nr:hypothetical protein [Bryobacteraceae bacterium]
MISRRRYDLVLAIYPNTRGFAFVLFEGPLAPVDWAVVEVRGKDRMRQCLRRISVLLGRYAPDALVLQDMSAADTHRARRIQNLNEAIEALAGSQDIPTFRYSRASVREHFRNAGLPTKQRIAESIAKQIPAFERFVPPPRKIWKSEDARMGLFDAAALGILHFARSGDRIPHEPG